MAKAKTKDVLGILARQEAGEWSWQCGDWDWRYAERHLYRVAGEREIVCGYYPRIEGAMGYSMGYADGLAEGRSQAPPPAAEGSPAGPPKAP